MINSFQKKDREIMGYSVIYHMETNDNARSVYREVDLLDWIFSWKGRFKGARYWDIFYLKAVHAYRYRFKWWMGVAALTMAAVSSLLPTGLACFTDKVIIFYQIYSFCFIFPTVPYDIFFHYNFNRN